MTEKFDVTELEVCTVCIHILANGEFNDGTDADDKARQGMAKLWGDDAMHLVAGDGEIAFSAASCDGCGDPLAGERHEAAALIPKHTEA